MNSLRSDSTRGRRKGTDGRQPAAFAALLLFSFAGILLLFLFDPATAGFYPPCLFRTILGVPCPGCGSLRAAHQLLHGNVSAAWELNKPLLVALPLAGAAAVLSFLLRRSSSPPGPT